ncbi:MAG: restriction endonuclease subunit S [Spirochaetales bacterium]|nr:restriction endonuclease subunit S [Spirochaetales bacterium]
MKITKILKDEFDLVLDAPESISKMRALILQLAVMGKLVEQDPNDEPASKLLEKLFSEKQKLINKGEIKKSRTFPQISEHNEFFKSPKRWAWIRLCELGTFAGGGTPSKNKSSFWDGPILWVSPKDMAKEHITTSELKISEEGVKNSAVKLIPKNSVLIVARSGILKRKLPVAINLVDCTVNQDMKVIIPFISGISEYIKLVLKGFEQYILQKLVKTGMTVQSLEYEKFELAPFPFPPLAEQKRIIEKVDRLMALCDELEAQQNERDTVQVSLNGAAFGALTQEQDQKSFQVNLNRVKSNFDLLVRRPENVKILRETILQLAVMGKLVKQDPNDEPASELLKRIKAEKEKLIEEGKIKRQKELPPIGEDEKPFALPKGWEWVRLGEACTKITDGTHHSPPNSESGAYKYVTAKNIKESGILLHGITYVTKKVHDEIYSRCDPEKGDLLYIKDGATTGIATINHLKEPFSMLSSVALLKLPKEINNKYMLHVLRSPFYYSETRGDMTGVGIPRVTLSKMNTAIIPIAPLSEQERISEKVERLMAYCDELEERLASSRNEGRKMLDAVVEELAG